jgi:hypothetical protein
MKEFSESKQCIEIPNVTNSATGRMDWETDGVITSFLYFEACAVLNEMQMQTQTGL